ncbi:TRAP transporter small permease [Sphaerotilus mobilis]|uniref:TRAP transporter small permease protein n=1 Tax=Sphaerotilus mobilis TaxID=47994 RepID=A0A4Q7LW22_9BURK|nr:TRAP transporter small permease [Sphaerotilus mobilis]RZS58208.1 TRAP-type C4-dicarboxylate transport system permease small subunit [Sphaerotilus mobilis]
MQENLSSDLPPGTVLGAYGRALRATSQVLALLGGLVFIGLVLMSIVSIVGRKVASAPVPGDVELLQMCAAFASASFFAWCHLNHGDVKVDFFTQKMRLSAVRKLDAFGSLLVGLFGAVVAWRSTAGALNLLEYQETSPILGLPVWIAQMLMVPGFVVLALAGLYMAVRQWKGHAA